MGTRLGPIFIYRGATSDGLRRSLRIVGLDPQCIGGQDLCRHERVGGRVVFHVRQGPTQAPRSRELGNDRSPCGIERSRPFRHVYSERGGPGRKPHDPVERGGGPGELLPPRTGEGDQEASPAHVHREDGSTQHQNSASLFAECGQEAPHRSEEDATHYSGAPGAHRLRFTLKGTGSSGRAAVPMRRARDALFLIPRFSPGQPWGHECLPHDQHSEAIV